MSIFYLFVSVSQHIHNQHFILRPIFILNVKFYAFNNIFYFKWHEVPQMYSNTQTKAITFVLSITSLLVFG